jgi:hypothetical protein
MTVTPERIVNIVGGDEEDVGFGRPRETARDHGEQEQDEPGGALRCRWLTGDHARDSDSDLSKRKSKVRSRRGVMASG